MFIDETWTKTNMSPLRGWAQKGQRLLGRAPYGHWNTMTFMAALRHDRIDAPFLLDGPINKVSFMAYIEQVLAPTLRPGDVVMADNLGCHKSKEVRAALRAGTGWQALVPPATVAPLTALLAGRATPL